MSRSAEPAAKGKPAVRASWLWLGLRLSALMGVGLSSAAAADRFAAAATFCTSAGGCAAVRASSIGQALGGSLPIIGLIGFGGVLLGSLASSSRVRLLALAAAVTGGVAGIALIALQALAIGAYCGLCLGTDAAAIVGGGCALLLRAELASSPALARRQAASWLAGLVLAAAGPLVWGFARPVAVPSYVRELQVPGRVTIVELSDFECPYCRAMHPSLAQLTAAHEGRIHFVRISVPLPGHAHARDAARAYACAREQSPERGEAMADALFESEALAPEDCVKHAQKVGLDLPRFAACVADPKTDERITRDFERVTGEGFEGLPTVWIGSERLTGFDIHGDDARHADALARALLGPSLLDRLLPGFSE